VEGFAVSKLDRNEIIKLRMIDTIARQATELDDVRRDLRQRAARVSELMDQREALTSINYKLRAKLSAKHKECEEVGSRASKHFGRIVEMKVLIAKLAEV